MPSLSPESASSKHQQNPGEQSVNDTMSSFNIKSYFQKLLAHIGVYERIKTSWLYDLYWNFSDRRILDDRNSEILFYRELLDGFHDGDLIFDVGANRGYKSDIFLRLGARVVAVEPDATCQDVLTRRFVKLRLRRKPFAIVDKAVSDSSVTKTMWIDTPGSAKNTLSEKWAETLRADEKRFGDTQGFKHSKDVQTTSLDDLIETHGVPRFIKIDVEGHELSVLRGLHKPVPCLSFEVNLPEFRSEGLQSIRILKTLHPAGEFNYTSDCRSGLAMQTWSSADQLCSMLSSCSDPSIEVFWRTHLRSRPS